MGIRNNFTIAMMLGLGLLVAACAEEEPEPEYQPSVDIEVNPDVDLSKYMTFDIVNPSPNAAGDPPANFAEAQAELEEAIVAELGDKGLTRDRESPQLLVNPLVSTTPATGVQQFYESVYGWYWGYEVLWTVKYDYIEGTLVLDVLDRRDPEDTSDDVLVYRGAASGLMAEDIEVIKLQIRNATHAIFASWPACTRTE